MKDKLPVIKIKGDYNAIIKHIQDNDVEIPQGKWMQYSVWIYKKDNNTYYFDNESFIEKEQS